MSERIEKTLKAFRTGLNCSQSVLTAFTDDLKVDNSLALSISCGFGAGMGRLQGTCGAVTGAFMAIGVYNCKRFTDNKDRKEETYAMVQRFNDRFVSLNGTTECRKLINCDLTTEAGRIYAHDHQLFEKVCEKCISDSVNILEDLIEV
jgi:C_GCAxxG_C_C family probable redox protein